MPPKRTPMYIEYEKEDVMKKARTDLLQKDWKILNVIQTTRGWKMMILPPMKK